MRQGPVCLIYFLSPNLSTCRVLNKYMRVEIFLDTDFLKILCPPLECSLQGIGAALISFAVDTYKTQRLKEQTHSFVGFWQQNV